MHKMNVIFGLLLLVGAAISVWYGGRLLNDEWQAASLKNEIKRFLSPRFVIHSSPVLMSNNTAESLDFEKIKERKNRSIIMENPNESRLVNVRFALQFPEAILKKSIEETSAKYRLIVREDFDKQPISVSGNATLGKTVETSGADQATGLWNCEVESVSAKGELLIEFTSTVGPEAKVYSGVKSNLITSKWPVDSILYYMIVSYQFEAGSKMESRELLIPIIYESTSREVGLKQPQSTKENLQLVKFRQGHGIKISGIFNSMGYVTAQLGRAVVFSSPTALERTNDLEFLMGLSGNPPETPFIKLSFKP